MTDKKHLDYITKYTQDIYSRLENIEFDEADETYSAQIKDFKLDEWYKFAYMSIKPYITTDKYLLMMMSISPTGILRGYYQNK